MSGDPWIFTGRVVSGAPTRLCKQVVSGFGLNGSQVPAGHKRVDPQTRFACPNKTREKAMIDQGLNHSTKGFHHNHKEERVEGITLPHPSQAVEEPSRQTMKTENEAEDTQKAIQEHQFCPNPHLLSIWCKSLLIFGLKKCKINL